ncbi:hypothetical protein [Halorarum halobium]|uniref:hypothetical protein n=1 Tax=Halorarum halobium TaxID=3075121 RepID=UPI0028ABCE2E|nr:hypothetical protein [Halobaculum sp. XH14]
MGLDQIVGPDRHEQFVDAITDQPVDYDDVRSRANTYAVGDDCRVWYHHAGEGFAGVLKQTRNDLVSADDRQLIHLFVLETKDAFETFVETHEDDLAAAATRITWYALPDDALDQYATAGSPNKFNVNEGNFEEMAAYRHDGRGVLG